MKFSCEKALLSAAVAVTSRAVAAKSSIPAMEGILVEAGAQLRLTGYNLETGIQATVPAEIKEKGSLVLSARLFGEIVRKMPDDVVVFSSNGYMVNVKCGLSEFNILGTDPEEFPELPGVDQVNGLTLPQPTLRSMIGQTLFAVSDNESRPIHTGSLFDVDKLRDVSKNVISRMSAGDVYAQVLDWARECDQPFAEALASDADFATAIFAIGRGGKKPRKDLAVWKEAKGYMGFFYDEFFALEDAIDEKFSRDDVRAALNAIMASYDPEDPQNVWFDKVKAIGEPLGYASDMKAYKAAPEQYKGSVADISMFLRIAVTGKLNSPDMYEVMRILGKEKVCARINALLNTIA